MPDIPNLKPTRKITGMGTSQVIMFVLFDPIQTACINLAAMYPLWLHYLSRDQYQYGLMALVSLVIGYFIPEKKENGNGSSNGTSSTVGSGSHPGTSSTGNPGTVARIALWFAGMYRHVRNAYA